MYHKPLLLSLTFISALLCSTASLADSVFGTGADKSKLTAISTILSTPEQYLSKPVTVEGTIVKVCKKRGCWMELASDKQYKTLRIKVRDGDMVFPMTAMGKTAYATGSLSAIPLDLAQTKKFLAYQAEEQNEAFDESSVTEAITVYQLNPVGVTIAD